MANFEDLTKDLNNGQLSDLQRHVNAVAESRRKKISLESINKDATPEHLQDVRREIARVLGETK